MSASQFDEFDRRMRRISRRHSKLSHGYVTTVNDDGMVVAKPKRKSRMTTVRALALGLGNHHPIIIDRGHIAM